MASINALYYSQTSGAPFFPLTQSIWLQQASRLLWEWRIDIEHFGTFLVFSGIRPRQQPCQVLSVITVRQRAPKLSPPTGGTLYVCKMQLFPRHLMKKHAVKIYNHNKRRYQAFQIASYSRSSFLQFFFNYYYARCLKGSLYVFSITQGCLFLTQCAQDSHN